MVEKEREDKDETPEEKIDISENDKELIRKLNKGVFGKLPKIKNIKNVRIK